MSLTHFPSPSCSNFSTRSKVKLHSALCPRPSLHPSQQEQQHFPHTLYSFSSETRGVGVATLRSLSPTVAAAAAEEASRSLVKRVHTPKSVQFAFGPRSERRCAGLCCFGSIVFLDDFPLRIFRVVCPLQRYCLSGSCFSDGIARVNRTQHFFPNRPSESY